MKKVLITGGAGYIGSHIALALLDRDREVVVVDNLVNGSLQALARVETITGKKLFFYHGDIRSAADLDNIFRRHHIGEVIHMAGLKSVSESISRPDDYYQNNVVGTLNLLDSMRRARVRRLIFSSSATVYGPQPCCPVDESCPTGATTNPYGTTKLIAEHYLRELAAAEPQLAITALRYFNPIGAHESGLIGEDPCGIPTNLLPYIFQVAIGKLEHLCVYGTDYPTPDGTGVRDYIHIMDLAAGHLKALDNLQPGFRVYNLGTGKGYSVMEIINAVEKISGRQIKWQPRKRRKGDAAECYADPSLAQRELSWQAERCLEKMIADAWRWHSAYPQGYVKE
ncbi:UDP-glucose 4-epimerase GalE [Kalamiella sp. sgz302252]|uniref:UDP-glucose 4-epimerase GalE n=1 Tax=Pantoea sp. sgz302252 TaxID=3341827 RepID=UPI0036D29418